MNSRQMNGPNSFRNRAYAAEMRAQWIGAQENLIQEQDTVLREQKRVLSLSISRISQTIAEGGRIVTDAAEVIANLPQADSDRLVKAEASARKAWKLATPSSVIATTKAATLSAN